MSNDDVALPPIPSACDVTHEMAYIWDIKMRLKALYDALAEDNNHRANCHIEIALNHLRLAEYDVEGMYDAEEAQ